MSKFCPSEIKRNCHFHQLGNFLSHREKNNLVIFQPRKRKEKQKRRNRRRKRRRKGRKRRERRERKRRRKRNPGLAH